MPPPPDAVLEHGRGNLHRIDDVRVRGELQKIWAHIEQRIGKSGNAGNESQRFVTLDELNAVKRKIGETDASALSAGYTPVVMSGSGGGGGGGGNLDILSANNRWTGTNQWSYVALPNAPSLRMESLQDGAIVLASPNSILTETGYTALLDIRKTSNNVASAATLGGNAAVYIQHRVSDSTALVGTVNCGIRVQLQTSQRAAASANPNDAVVAYMSLLNQGTNSVGYGTHLDLYHATLGQSVNGGTYGHSVELYRSTGDGVAVAFHARIPGFGTAFVLPGDVAFLASGSPSGGGPKWGAAFAAGSSLTWGNMNCDIGLDLTYASCTLAAISMKANQRLQLNAPNYGVGSVGLYFDQVGVVQFYSDLGKTFAIGNDGSIILNRPETDFRQVSGAYGGVVPVSPGTPLTIPFAYLLVHLGGPGAATSGYIPFYKPA